jgi:hypothetical protein
LFAGQRLGVDKFPGRVIESTLLSEEVFGVRNVFYQTTKPKSWLMPAVKLIAWAQLCEGAVNLNRLAQGEFGVEVDGYQMRVTREEIYNSSCGKTVKAEHPAEDVYGVTFDQPKLATNSPTLIGLHNTLLPVTPDAGTLVRGLVWALRAGVVTEGLLLGDLMAPPSGRAYVPPRALLDRSPREAEAAAIKVLSSGGDSLMRNLYGAVVPTLFSAQEFTSTFGSTSSVGRTLRPQTRESWLVKISARALRRSPNKK